MNRQYILSQQVALEDDGSEHSESESDVECDGQPQCTPLTLLEFATLPNGTADRVSVGRSLIPNARVSNHTSRTHNILASMESNCPPQITKLLPRVTTRELLEAALDCSRLSVSPLVTARGCP